MNRHEAAEAIKQMLSVQFSRTLTDHNISIKYEVNGPTIITVEYLREGKWAGYTIALQAFNTDLKQKILPRRPKPRG